MELILAEGQKASSVLIRLFTRSTITHSALLWNGTPAKWMLHSTIGGVQAEVWKVFLQHYPKSYRYRCMWTNAEEVANTILQRTAGRPYDYLSFVGSGLAILFGLKTNPLGQSKALHCTELPAQFLNLSQQVDPSLKIPHIDPELLTPAKLKEFCDNRRDLFTPIE